MAMVWVCFVFITTRVIVTKTVTHKDVAPFMGVLEDYDGVEEMLTY